MPKRTSVNSTAAKSTAAKSATAKSMPVKSMPGKSASIARKPAEQITAVRHSPIPKKTKTVVVAKREEITFDQIARKAYEIHASGNGGSELDNWFQAERELRGTV